MLHEERRSCCFGQYLLRVWHKNSVSLAPGNGALRVMSRFAGPLARVAHDWVLDTGARQFISRAIPAVPGE